MLNKKSARFTALFLVMFMGLIVCSRVEAASNLKFFTNSSTPIQLTIPYGAGGGTDTIARKVAAEVQKIIGKTIVCTNMPGAAGAIGAAHFKKQAPDGFNLMFFPETLGLYPAMGQSNLTVDDFIQIYGFDFAPGTFVVKPDSPHKDLASLAKAAKVRDGVIKISSSGIGDAWYLCIALFEKYAGVKIETIPYDSGKDAALAALKGEVDAGGCGLIEVADFLVNGQLRSLAVFAPEDYQIPGYGTVPSAAKTYPDMKPMLPAGSWHGAFLPLGTPKEIIDYYIKYFDEYCKSDTFAKFCVEKGLIRLALPYPKVQDYARQYAKKFSYFLYDAGVAVRNPADVGVTRK